MKTGLTLTDLARKIEAQKELKHDLIAPTRQLRAVVDEDGAVSLQAGEPGNRFPMLQLAHNQVAQHVGIPTKYYDRMRTTAPDLLARNVNEWFSRADETERRMIRTLGGDMRAFLSNRFNRIENENLAEATLPVLADVPDIQIVSSEVTERRLYIQAVSPRTQGEVKVGDAVQAGVIISNSEVGCGAVSVAPLIYRLRCLNGMVIPDAKFRAYHVGRLIENSDVLWAQDTLKADDSAVLLKVRDTVRAALDDAHFQQRVARMRDLTGVTFAETASIEKGIEVLAKKVGATDAERGGILASLIRGGDLSAWGVLNAVTAQAHTAETYDRSVELETIGGHLLDLSPRDWSEVLEA